MSKDVGVYLHIPYCVRKCPYCDFYSLEPGSAGSLSDHSGFNTAMLKAMEPYRGLRLSTVYFGGGTPSLMGAPWLVEMLNAVKDIFTLEQNAEITLEVNPGDPREGFFETLFQAGFNRVSIGMQSANDTELKRLGRRHSRAETAQAVAAAKEAGFQNISLDLMLALPDMSGESLAETLGFALDQGIQHLSAYILKIEPDTPFARVEKRLCLPNEDTAADFYFQTIETLTRNGFTQYEISNFALPGYESRHNLIYWSCEEYLGFGPSAHSFYNGRRFYYPRDLQAFLRGAAPVDDGPGGDIDEYIMLKLRLAEGLTRAELSKRYSQGNAVFDRLLERVKKCPPEDLKAGMNKISLTPEGFAVSNAILAVLLEGI